MVSFMVRMLSPVAPGAKPLSVANLPHQGPWIVAATVGVPLVVAALANRLKARGQGVNAADAQGRRRCGGHNHVYAGSRLWPSWPGGWLGACWW
jgi:PAT family beta-lactamase induction signal transducer AmpG